MFVAYLTCLGRIDILDTQHLTTQIWDFLQPLTRSITHKLPLSPMAGTVHSKLGQLYANILLSWHLIPTELCIELNFIIEIDMTIKLERAF